MFGASEDRARQLAGRQRWKRIGSSASHRSVSSLSQASYWETSSIFEQNIHRPTSTPEHHAQHIAHISSDVEVALSEMMTSDHHPRAQQQRSQAEHLSQVLYNDTATGNPLDSSSNHFVPPTHMKKHGALESTTTIYHRLRNASAPTPQTYMVDHQSTLTPAHQVTSRSVSTGTADAHATVSMRGGADGGPSLSPLYSNDTTWVSLALYHPCWDLPFNSGIMYKFFLDSLPPTQIPEFILVFGARKDHKRNMFSSARREFFNDLDFDDRLNFKRAIMERAKELLGPHLNQRDYQLHDVLRIEATSKEGGDYPLVCLSYLVEAIVNMQTAFPPNPVMNMVPNHGRVLDSAAVAR
jgi:hypothetical protein